MDGSTVGGRFGLSLAKLGDLDRDGFDDLAIGEYSGVSRGRPKVDFSPSAEVGTFPHFFSSEGRTFRRRKVIKNENVSFLKRFH